MNAHLKALRQACEDYKELRKADEKSRWPELVLVAVKKESQPWQADEEHFKQIVEALNKKGQSGWARLQSALIWTGNSDRPGHERGGSPLQAEWTETPDLSCRLQADPDKPGQTRLWRYHERILGPDSTPDEGETAFLRQETALLGHPARLKGRFLGYHVFWGAGPQEDAHALRRVFARFTGFSPQEGTE